MPAIPHFCLQKHSDVCMFIRIRVFRDVSPSSLIKSQEPNENNLNTFLISLPLQVKDSVFGIRTFMTPPGLSTVQPATSLLIPTTSTSRMCGPWWN